MEELYSSKWVKKNGAIASSLWLEALSTLTNEQIKTGLQRCKDKIFGGNAWAPDLAEFLAMIHGHDDVDFDMAYSRMLAREPEGRVEQWVYERAAFNIRRESDDKARRSFKRFMKEAMELERQGKLQLNEEMLKALPPNSVINTNDLERQKYESSGKKHRLADRINALRKRK